jgi:hypothetical protein
MLPHRMVAIPFLLALLVALGQPPSQARAADETLKTVDGSST